MNQNTSLQNTQTVTKCAMKAQTRQMRCPSVTGNGTRVMVTRSASHEKASSPCAVSAPTPVQYLPLRSREQRRENRESAYSEDMEYRGSKHKTLIVHQPELVRALSVVWAGAVLGVPVTHLAQRRERNSDRQALGKLKPEQFVQAG